MMVIHFSVTSILGDAVIRQKVVVAAEVHMAGGDQAMGAHPYPYGSTKGNF
jgi:hypothetical protein